MQKSRRNDPISVRWPTLSQKRNETGPSDNNDFDCDMVRICVDSDRIYCYTMRYCDWHVAAELSGKIVTFTSTMNPCKNVLHFSYKLSN